MLPVAPCHTNDIVLTLVSYIDVIGFALDFVIGFVKSLCPCWATRLGNHTLPYVPVNV